MSDHIVELLRKRKLRALKQSQAMAEARENHVSGKAQHVKTMMGGAAPEDTMSAAAVNLKALYYEMMKAYTGKFPPFTKTISQRSVSLWERVAVAREKSGVEAERFMKAQFVWFDKSFGTTPKKHQLATEAAIERAQEYGGSTKGRVYGNSRPAQVNKAESFKQSEKLLQKMMRAQKCTREEFYRDFVLTGVYVFPQEFLKADPVYRKVANG